jgi:hypothetical protein
VNANSAAPLEWAPEATDAVRALAVSGRSAYVGGLFDGVGGRARESAAAIDMATGAIADWDPSVQGFGGVDALLAAGSTVYLAGDSEWWEAKHVRLSQR